MARWHVGTFYYYFIALIGDIFLFSHFLAQKFGFIK